jgi:hypothetical protein
MVISFVSRGGYERVKLKEKGKNSASHTLSVHKIVNQVLKNGSYSEIVDHKDEVKDNNDPDNLDEVTLRENSIRARGKSVKMTNPETGESTIFRSISLALEFINRSGSSATCNGIYGTAFGFEWEWSDQ